MGISVPGSKPRLPSTAEAAAGSDDGSEGSEGSEECEEGEGAAALGAARPRGETAEAKRERKNAAKGQKQAPQRS